MKELTLTQMRTFLNRKKSSIKRLETLIMFAESAPRPHFLCDDEGMVVAQPQVGTLIAWGRARPVQLGDVLVLLPQSHLADTPLPLIASEG